MFHASSRGLFFSRKIKSEQEIKKIKRRVAHKAAVCARSQRKIRNKAKHIVVLYFRFRLFFSPAAKNRTSSTSSQQPTNIGNKISVSSSNFKREASPTVCCYNINSRSQSLRKGDQSGGEIDSVADARRAEKSQSHDQAQPSAPTLSSNLHRNRSQAHKLTPSDGCRLIASREIVGFSQLKDKIRRFENPPNNIHENIINRSTTSTTTTARRAEETTAADVDPVKSVSEDDRRIYDDKNSRTFSTTFLINRDESQSRRTASERCNLSLASDGNNNRVKEVHDSDTVSGFVSSLTAPRQLRDINTHCCAKGDDIKVTKVVIKHLAPIVKTGTPTAVLKQSSFDDNDFSFIDSSSRSVSRSSSASFVDDETVTQKQFRIPKITRINSYSREFSVKACANQNIYIAQNACDATKAQLNQNNLERAGHGQHLKAPTNSFDIDIVNQQAVSLLKGIFFLSRDSISISMERARRIVKSHPSCDA